MKYYSILLFTIIIHSCSTTSNKRNEASNINNSYKLDSVIINNNEKVKTIDSNNIILGTKNSANVYCFCFDYGIEQNLSNICLSSINIESKHLIDSNYLYTVLEGSKLERIKKSILNYNKSYVDNNGVDVRFTISFNDSAANFISYFDDSTLIYNDTLMLKYNFNIADSIVKVLGKDYIFCDSNGDTLRCCAPSIPQ